MILRLSIRVRDADNPGRSFDWMSDGFDTNDTRGWGRTICAEKFACVSTGAMVSFTLIGDSSIRQDENWGDKFEIEAGTRGGKSVLRFQRAGCFEQAGKTVFRFFGEAGYGSFDGPVFVVFRMQDPQSDVSEKKPVFTIPVQLVDKFGREKLYDKMLAEVLNVNVGLALPEDSRMLAPRTFSVKYSELNRGDSDVSNAVVHFRQLMHDVDDFFLGKNALLRVIQYHVTTCVDAKAESRLTRYGHVRRPTLQHRGMLLMRGLDEGTNEGDMCIVEEAIPGDSPQTRSNRAIRAFIDCFLQDAGQLQVHFEERHRYYMGMKVEMHDGNRYMYRIEDSEKYAKKLKEAIGRIRSLFLGPYSFWRQIKGDINIFNPRIQWNDFRESVEYREVYVKIARYYLRRYFHGNEMGEHYLPVMKTEGMPQETGKQRRYDFLYESWVFVRILQAFDHAGIHLPHAYESLLRSSQDIFLGLDVNAAVEGSCVVDGLVVGVTYGVSVSKGAWTPDYKIEFRNKLGQKYTLILDAKAVSRCDSVRCNEARNKYLGMNVDGVAQNPPDQVWMIYEGSLCDDSGRKSAVEFSEADCPGVGFGDRNKGFAWQGRAGIVWVLPDLKPRGHGHVLTGNLRVNGQSVEVNNIFNEFVAGQVATARRQLGLLR